MQVKGARDEDTLIWNIRLDGAEENEFNLKGVRKNRDYYCLEAMQIELRSVSGLTVLCLSQRYLISSHVCLMSVSASGLSHVFLRSF